MLDSKWWHSASVVWTCAERTAEWSSGTVIVSRISSGQAHTGEVRVLVAVDHVALANRIGERWDEHAGPVSTTVVGVGYGL
jgi:hypothetical protein